MLLRRSPPQLRMEMMEEQNSSEGSNENSASFSSSLDLEERDQNSSMSSDPGTTNVQKPKYFPIFSKNFSPPVNPLKAVQLEVEKHAPRKRKRTMLGKETSGLTQMVLDAGQKEIGPKFCEECGLLYSPGDFQDEEEHRKAHLRLEGTFSLTLWKEARIIFTYPDNCLILMVQCNVDSKRVKNRLRDFLAWLDSELGAGYNPSGTNDTERIFLYVTRTKRKNVVRILGCGIMEIPNATKITACNLVSTADEAAIYEYHEERTIMIGITRLWTDSGFRNKKIASKICEMMRFNSGIPGCVIPKDQIGILEPSEAGREFMKKYTSSSGALYTYKC